ncbi:response regulator receiver modulated metal dependent phosphohydrolase [Candidatus Scalindua japonica]|uniref:Response regulator receiver modulated metal dependent phosphohydrolase n=2 Tax=Candidatus Scalindua japonica TaxID=1284222 RepID=A0A286TZ13_9BACT|nr:response regulator receiver modulated metal dependent phosphohydrolase [Candidatus Scalindua japonica]
MDHETGPVKPNILIVDDSDINLKILNDLIEIMGYTPVMAENGLYALSVLENQACDLVLLDIRMPEMDGYQVLKIIKNDPHLSHIPVIMISALSDMDNVIRCIESGADDYMVKPFVHAILRARIDACLEKKQMHDKESRYQEQIESFNLELQNRVSKQVSEITAAQRATIFAMAKLAESRDPETGEHLLRIREYVRFLCQQLRFLTKYENIIDDNYIENICAASPLHDIGKVGIADGILLKPDKLTDEEFNAMKAHTCIGAETLREVYRLHSGNDFVRIGIDIAESHHEKWDGTGYPHGLAGENIPLVGRILALSDVYDALTSRRCYKEAFSHTRSIKIIVDGSGKHFDPDVVDAFIKAEKDFVSIREYYVDG